MPGLITREDSSEDYLDDDYAEGIINNDDTGNQGDEANATNNGNTSITSSPTLPINDEGATVLNGGLNGDAVNGTFNEPGNDNQAQDANHDDNNNNNAAVSNPNDTIRVPITGWMGRYTSANTPRPANETGVQEIERLAQLHENMHSAYERSRKAVWTALVKMAERAGDLAMVWPSSITTEEYFSGAVNQMLRGSGLEYDVLAEPAVGMPHPVDARPRWWRYVVDQDDYEDEDEDGDYDGGEDGEGEEEDHGNGHGETGETVNGHVDEEVENSDVVD